MAQAIFGLVGVVIGGLLATLQNYALERRREGRNIRSAARLVQEEFMDGMMSAGLVWLFGKDQPVKREIVVSEDSWLQHQPALATALPGRQWSELSWAAKHRRDFIGWITQEKASRGTLFNDDYTDARVRNFHHWANRGWDALSKAAGFSWRARRRIRRLRDHDLAEQRASSDTASR